VTGRGRDRPVRRAFGVLNPAAILRLSIQRDLVRAGSPFQFDWNQSCRSLDLIQGWLSCEFVRQDEDDPGQRRRYCILQFGREILLV